MFRPTPGCNSSKDHNNEKKRVIRNTNNSSNLNSVHTKVYKKDEYYNGNEYTGLALIFNHEKIDEEPDRKGTEEDLKRISESLKNYGFEVRSYNDEKYADIKIILKNAAAEDHSENDCLVVVVMSHGQTGRVFAKDVPYLIKKLWKPFTGNRCKSLIDKPKLFFLQACRGCKPEKGVDYSHKSKSRGIDSIETDTVGKTITYTRPVTADLLLSFSTFDSSFSCRNIKEGSWFIQSLAKVLDASIENPMGTEITAILLSLARTVAYGYEIKEHNDPEKHEMKQMPAYISTLTKKFYLKKKKPKKI